LSTFFLTLTNPLTILSFAAVFAGLGLGAKPGDFASAGSMVAGVFSGSSLWWLFLSGGMDLFRKQFSQNALFWVNRISGLIIVGFGVFALWGAIMGVA
jgi:threonine/homoserine/homoserine lactone efflux protein